MNIVIIGRYEFDNLAYHWHEGLAKMGHDVKCLYFDRILSLPETFTYYAARVSEPFDIRMSKRLARRVLKENPEFVLVFGNHYHPALVRSIKKANPDIIVAHFNPDAMLTLEFQNQKTLASDYDYYFCKDPFLVDALANKNELNVFYLPESFNPRCHRRPDRSKEEIENEVGIDVLVFGSMYPYRANLVKLLTKYKINVHALGTQKRYVSKEAQRLITPGYVTGSEKSEILFGAKIVFNFMHFAEHGVNKKYFEINGIGGFQLSDRKPVLDEYSPISKEKISFNSVKESVEMINHFLDNPEQRYEIAEEQYQHFRKNHTYEERIKEMFNVIFADGSGLANPG